MFLTQSEIQQLTNRKRKTAQIRCLKKQNIAYTLDADGRPVVLRDAVSCFNTIAPQRPKLRLPSEQALFT
jgi:hypothetical protein